MTPLDEDNIVRVSDASVSHPKMFSFSRVFCYTQCGNPKWHCDSDSCYEEAGIRTFKMATRPSLAEIEDVMECYLHVLRAPPSSSI
jgi:hypothetical protein